VSCAGDIAQLRARQLAEVVICHGDVMVMAMPW
jgi:hypothetical protein